jgi:hypothetical protein
MFGRKDKKDKCERSSDDEASLGSATPDDVASPSPAAPNAEPSLVAAAPKSYGGLLKESQADLECRVRSDPAIWRAQAFDAYANVRDELNRLEAPPSQPNATKVIENVKEALAESLRAMAPPCRLPRRPMRWWYQLKLFYSGSRIEQAWLAVHRARAEIYLLYPDTELKAQTESLGVLLADLPETSTLRGGLTTALGHLGNKIESGTKAEPNAKVEPGVRAELQRIYGHAIGVSNVLQREARVLRNNMMVASLGIFMVVLALGVAHLLDSEIVSLCSSKVCPLASTDKPLDVFVVELAGMLGGLLSVVIPLASGERIMTPYRVFNQQLVLKTLAGAASAVGGVLLVGSEIITVVKFKTPAALLGYAVVFGFAQQIVTGAVDRRANTLAKETPTVKGV